jgi:hypothetical protein
MQNHLIGPNRLASAKILEDLTGLGAALLGIDLPANDLAADMTSRVKRDPFSVFQDAKFPEGGVAVSLDGGSP